MVPVEFPAESNEQDKGVKRERKKVVSVWAGFRKRAVRLDQHNIDMSLKRDQSEFKISRRASRKVIYKKKTQKVEKV